MTTGTPIALLIDNVDQRSKDYSDIKDKYRPGHADYTYDVKYGLRDYRGGGRHSARETATRVAAGAIARKVVPGLTVRGALVQMGPHRIDRARWDWDEVDRNPFFCPDAETRRILRRLISTACARAARPSARSSRSSPKACRPGLGAPIYGKLDGDLAAALMSINAVKGVEIGAGFACGRAHRRGERRRDAHAAMTASRVSLQPRRRHPRRHLDRPAGRRALCRQADLVDPHPAPHRRPLRPRGRDLDHRPPRSLRRHPRRADRRSHGGVRDRRSLSTPSRPGRRHAVMAVRAANAEARSG